MSDFINRCLSLIKQKEQDPIQQKFNDTLNKLLPNVKQHLRPIECLHKHYIRSCIAMESCSNYILHVYPNYIKQTHLDIYKLQLVIDYNENKIQLHGYNKEDLIVSLYNIYMAEKEIQMINDILWFLQRDHSCRASITKAMSFMEFYERKYTHPERKNYRQLLSEYL